jgi:hypothetical protein
VRIGVTGHQAIPDDGRDYIVKGIDHVLKTSARPVVAISSLAAGADQLFARAALALGADLEAVLPCKHYERTFASEPERKEFHRLLAAAKRAHALDFSEPSQEAFFEAGKMVVDLSDELVAIWDGQPARGYGGTTDVVHYAATRGKKIAVVWPAGMKR